MKVYVLESMARVKMNLGILTRMDLTRKKENHLYRCPVTKEGVLYFPIPNWGIAEASRQRIQTTAVGVDIQLLAQTVTAAQVKLGK